MNNLEKPSLPIGIDDFRKVRENGAYFVDKSLLIKDLIDVGAEVTLFTRPRRFGKTVNMSMLRYFFDKTGDYKRLFEDLKIMEAGDQYLQHQGRYPVVFLTLKNIKASHWEDCYAQLTKCLSDVYAQHRYLLDSDVLNEIEVKRFKSLLDETASMATLQDSLGELTQYLHRYHGEPVVVLLDEYDTPLHMVTDWFQDSIPSDYLDKVWGFLVQGDVTNFKRLLTSYIEEVLSYFDVTTKEPERFYHALVLGMLVNLRAHYQIRSNRESGYGRYDIMLLPDRKGDLGVVIEFKRVFPDEGGMTRALEAAHQQIEEKGYVKELQAQGIEKILTLAIAFQGKEVGIEERHV